MEREKKPKSGCQLHQTYRTTRCDETVYPNITWFQRLLSYWRTRMLTWLFRQKLLFLAMKAFIALVFVRNLTSTILMGSGTPGLRKLSNGGGSKLVPHRKRSMSSGRAFRGTPCNSTAFPSKDCLRSHTSGVIASILYRRFWLVCLIAVVNAAFEGNLNKLIT